MNPKTTSVGRLLRRFRPAIVSSSALCVMLPALVSVASAQPAPAASEPAPAPAAPSDSGATPPTRPTPSSAAATPQPPANPDGAASTVTPPPPAAQSAPTKHDEYDGPPLLLTPKNKKATLGGYGGLTVAYSHMLHRDGVVVGGEGGMLIEHRLSLGGAGYGFSRTPGGPSAADGTARQFYSGYGGFLIRYAVYSDIPLYASFGVLIGGGAVSLAPHTDHHTDNHGESVEVRGYFVVQPDVSVHANVTRWLRFSLMAGYRIATAVDAFHYQADDIGGVVLGGNVQMGWF